MQAVRKFQAARPRWYTLSNGCCCYGVRVSPISVELRDERPWTESECGWGQRPDGYSVHVSEEAAKDYIRDYWHRMPDDFVPDEYSFPSRPIAIEVPDDGEVAEQMANRESARFYGSFPTTLEIRLALRR